MTRAEEEKEAAGRAWLRGRFGKRRPEAAVGAGAVEMPPESRTPQPASSGWHAQDIDQLAHALADFHNPVNFEQLLRLMGRRLGSDTAFAVSRYDDPRDQFAALALAVDRYKEPDDALHALADTMRSLRRDEAAMVRLDDLVEDLAPATRLPGARLRAIVAELDGMKAKVPVALAGEALRRALLPGEPSGFRGTETVSELVRRLSDVRAAPTDVRTAAVDDPADAEPLVLRFLAELAGSIPGDAAELLRSHVVLAARELGLTPRARAALADRGRRQQAAALTLAHRRVLQIRLRETAPGKQEYRLDAALFDRTDTGLSHPLRREAPRTYTLRQLQELGRTCLVEWADLAAHLDDADWVQLEFLLPWSLLGHPVEHWLTDGDEYLAGHKYPVVVRSLDRMERPSWRRDWARRWNAFQSSAAGPSSWPSRLGWLALDPDASHASLAPHCDVVPDVLHLRGRDGEVRGWLDKHPETTGLGLAFAYDHKNTKRALGLQEAVCEGVPFVVWRRDDGDPGELAARIREMAGAKIGELPDRVRLWRRSAPRDDPADMHNHLTLLWDDPECIFRETALTGPSTT